MHSKEESCLCVASFQLGIVTVELVYTYNTELFPPPPPSGWQVASLQLEMEAVYASLEDEALEIAPDAQGNR